VTTFSQHTYNELGGTYRRLHELIIKDGIPWDMQTGGVLQLLATSIIAQGMTKEEYLEAAGKAYDIIAFTMRVQKMAEKEGS
jgi:predicted P-loop ATPase/GTPase